MKIELVDFEACDNCIMAIANDDYSGMSDEEERATREGLAAIGEWLSVGDELGFSWRRCDICDGLAGNRHAVFILPGGAK